MQKREARLRVEEAESRADRAEMLCKELQVQVRAADLNQINSSRQIGLYDEIPT